VLANRASPAAPAMPATRGDQAAGSARAPATRVAEHSHLFDVGRDKCKCQFITLSRPVLSQTYPKMAKKEPQHRWAVALDGAHDLAACTYGRMTPRAVPGLFRVRGRGQFDRRRHPCNRHERTRDLVKELIGVFLFGQGF